MNPAELRLTVTAPVRRVVQVGRMVVEPAVAPSAVEVDPFPFVGRDRELLALGRAQPGAVLFGAPGTGTTRLAVEWAARDGRSMLFVDVAGERSPVGRALLELGAPQVPDDRDAAAGLLRSLLRNRPRPVVLDGVTDEDQARPFVTGSAPVVATAARPLSGLTVDGWLHLPLRGLPPPDRVALLRAGTGWTSGGDLLLLAQALGGEPAVVRMAFGAAKAVGDPAALGRAVRASRDPQVTLARLAWTALSRTGRHVLRTLAALLVETDSAPASLRVDVPVAAAVAGLDVPTVAATFAELVRYGLLQHDHGGYRLPAGLRLPAPARWEP